MPWHPPLDFLSLIGTLTISDKYTGKHPTAVENGHDPGSGLETGTDQWHRRDLPPCARTRSGHTATLAVCVFRFEEWPLRRDVRRWQPSTPRAPRGNRVAQ